MKKLNFSLVALFLLILIGGGCEKAENKVNENELNTKPAFGDILDDEKNTEKMTGITIKADANTDGSVDVYWEVDENIAEKTDSYRLIYDRMENPTHPGYMWFERGKIYRDKYWTGLPAGEGYIRVCAVQNTKCVEYSNNIMIEIPETGANAFIPKEEVKEEKTEEVIEEEPVVEEIIEEEVEDIEEDPTQK